jgi:hypothetical protein
MASQEQGRLTAHLIHWKTFSSTFGLTGTMGGALAGSSRQDRIFFIAPGEWTAHRTLILEPQRGQERTSISKGTDSTYCHTGTSGNTWSTRLAAVSAMRRPPHDGQKPRITRVRNDAIHAADVAMNPHKTSGQNTAIKKRTQFAFHKPGNHSPTLLLPNRKGLRASRGLKSFERHRTRAS